MVFTAAWHGGRNRSQMLGCALFIQLWELHVSARHQSTRPVSQPCVSRSSHAGWVAPLQPSCILCIESEVVRGNEAIGGARGRLVVVDESNCLVPTKRS